MPILWLRVALVFYAIGLLYALVALSGRRETLTRLTLPAMGLGLVFHFVALAESVAVSGHWTPVSIHQSESLLAFLVTAFFGGMYLKYRTISPGIFIFPLIFLLTLSAAVGQDPPQFSSPLLRSGWIFVHIALIFGGYAALFFSFVASLLYLLQERNLKTKGASRPLTSAGLRLPALEVIDEIGYRSLLLGFPFMTLGLIAGSVIAQASFGPAYFLDPKVLLSILMWAVYMVLVYTRWSAGWRGRRAAFLSTCAFLVAVGAWAANYFSAVHRYVGP